MKHTAVETYKMYRALQGAIEIVGNQSALSRICQDDSARGHISSQAVTQWTKAPARWCRTIEDATGGVITRYELRPDVFGDQA